MLFRGIRKDGSKPIIEVWADAQVSNPEIGGMVVAIRRWEERYFLDQAIEAMEASWPLDATYQLLVAVAESEVLDARAAIWHDRVGDRFAGVVASEGLAPTLCGPTLASERAVAEGWQAVTSAGRAEVYDVSSLPTVLRDPAEDAGFCSLWYWPSVIRDDRPSGAIAIGWRAEPHLDADQTRRLGMARIARLAGLALERVRSEERSLATVVFTDIVDSTSAALRSGDAVWRQLLARHDEIVRWAIGRYRGTEVKQTGDGFLATFDRPTQALKAALDITSEVRDLGFEVRIGVHLDEIESRDEDIGGVGVHIAARIMNLAGPSEIFVSRTVRDVISGSGLCLADRGDYFQLKGIPGSWQGFSVLGTDSDPT
jgi:class 3 adenylate cyclase